MSTANSPVVLITGAAGAVGSALCRALRGRYTVIGLDLRDSPAADASITFDLTSDESVRDAIAGVRERYGPRIASCLHLAAYFDFTGEENPLYEEINVEGTRRLLRYLRVLRVEQFVYSSTMLVHAPCRPGHRIDESSPLGPRWIYPSSKARTEEVIRAERGSVPIVLLRLAGVYDERSAVPTLAQQIARIYQRQPKSRFYSGNLEVGQAALHVEDMVDAFVRTIERRHQLPEEIEFLIGEDTVISYGALQEKLGCLIHGEQRWRTLIVPKPLAKAGAWAEVKLEPVIPDAIDQGKKPFIRPFMIAMADDHYALDVSRARRLLGWSPRHRFDETVPALVAALKEDPLGWYERNGVTPPPWLSAAAGTGAQPELVRSRYEQEFRREHARFLWAHFVNVAIGCWLMVAPFVLGYESAGLARSDVAAGFLLVLLALPSLSWRLSAVRWAAGGIGVWLLLAPLVFWAPTSAEYLNGTLMGALVIGFAAASRPAPGVSPAAAMTGPTVPPGWMASPSSWQQRLPIIALAFVGLFCSLYMTAYQLGHLETIWDPFFPGGADAPNGTAAVITSDISEAFPVPDAGLGAVVYTLEILLGFIGSQRRWRTMPWVVASFGFLIVPLGIVSITFIIIQPILIGTWCALCLIAAGAMLLQIAYSANELVATGQFLLRRWRAGQPFLRVFFVGDTDEARGHEGRAPRGFERPPGEVLREVLTEGVTVPWNLALAALLGVSLMFTRLTLGTEGAMADADHLIGSLIVTVSVIAWAEVARPVRYLNVLLGAALLATPFLFDATAQATIAGIVAGLLLIVLTPRRGPIHGRYGTWDRLLI